MRGGCCRERQWALRREDSEMLDLKTVHGLCVDVDCLITGPLQNNVYLISDDEAALVVDPAENAEAILSALDGKKLAAIVLTHGHWDHTGAAAELRRLSGAPVIAGVADADQIERPSDIGTSRVSNPCPVDVRVKTGDVVRAGGMQWKVLETPGHSPGSICLFIVPPFGNHADGLPVLVSGDTLFKGTFGRTDFEGGSMQEMGKSMKRLAALPDDVAVLPGHNDLTTIGNERSTFALFGDEPEE